MNSLDVCLACTPVLDSNVEPSAVHSGPRAGVVVVESSESVPDMTTEALS